MCPFGRSKVSNAQICIIDRLNFNCFNNTAVLFSIHIMKCRGHVITSFVFRFVLLLAVNADGNIIALRMVIFCYYPFLNG